MSTQTFGRYKIIRELGQGGMAMVYLAHDPLFDRQVAVKVLSLYLLQDPSFRSRFEREAKVIAALEHEAIVPVYDVGEYVQQPYLVMRFMPGGTLAERISEGPMPWPEIVRILFRVAGALDEAHAHKIVHRDLKPQNILFDSKGDPFLSDFGLAKISGPTASYTGTAIVGTPSYMSPEQAKGETLDGRSDVYTLAVILYEMITGRLPYDADTPMGLAVKHIVEPVPNIRSVKPDLSQECEALMTRALAKDPANRFASAGEMARALADLPEVKALGSEAAVPTLKIVRPEAQGVRRQPSDRLPGPDESAAAAASRPGAGFQRLLSAIPGGRVGLIVVAVIVFLALGTGAFALITGSGRATATTVATNAVRTPVTAVAGAATPTGDAATVAPGATMVSPVDKAVLVYVPAGSFLMGSDLGGLDERPVHKVTVNGFWIDRTEVTNAQYAQCVAAGACQPPSNTSSASHSLYYGDTKFDNFPVLYVVWDSAVTYCKWAGKRLPTEAEWEKAAAGTDQRLYPWGKDAPTKNLLNFSSRDTVAVGSYPDGASPYGALDMAGNVSEWVSDWYSESYYSESSEKNPTGPTSGQYRVLRGGAWNTNEFASRTADQFRIDPTTAFAFTGFRCAGSP
ncbi:MAG: SUMF1/EgtB/PvdO family nonheme iron enzyme [Chloroflexi bacterium]|nr:SUMF1/EgtB/PvdO family nonheme iron enzyme [Chloroflexota bacterium]